MEDRNGQCLCGAVRFEAKDVKKEYATCHCIMCQRWAGGPFFSTSVGDVVFHGEEHLTRYQSSAWAERGFCNVCGSNLFYRLKKSTSHEICIGAFAHNNDLVMTSEIFIDRKPDGYALAGDHPRLTEAETLARYADIET